MALLWVDLARRLISNPLDLEDAGGFTKLIVWTGDRMQNVSRVGTVSGQIDQHAFDSGLTSAIRGFRRVYLELLVPTCAVLFLLLINYPWYKPDNSFCFDIYGPNGRIPDERHFEACQQAGANGLGEPAGIGGWGSAALFLIVGLIYVLRMFRVKGSRIAIVPAIAMGAGDVLFLNTFFTDPPQTLSRGWALSVSLALVICLNISAVCADLRKDEALLGTTARSSVSSYRPAAGNWQPARDQTAISATPQPDRYGQPQAAIGYVPQGEGFAAKHTDHEQQPDPPQERYEWENQPTQGGNY